MHVPRPATCCTYLDVAIRRPAVFDGCTSSLLQGFLVRLQALWDGEERSAQGWRQETPQSTKQQQEPQSCPCNTLLRSQHPMAPRPLS